MPAKSQIRKDAEAVLFAYGFVPGEYVFTDTNKGSKRVKFVGVTPGSATLARHRAAFAAQYPLQQTTVQIARGKQVWNNPMWKGVAFTVING